MDIKTEQTEEQKKAAKHRQRVQQVQQEYNLACAELGQSVYKIAALEWEIGTEERNQTSLKQRLKELNEKAGKLSKGEPEIPIPGVTPPEVAESPQSSLAEVGAGNE